MYGVLKQNIQLIEPGSLYAGYQNQLDVRLSKRFNLHRYHVRADANLYNVFNNAYAKKNFRPLLMIKSADIQGKREGKPVDDILYVSWIKRFGKGRVFFVSPGHFPESYQSKAMLRFYLDGIQYALGDLECDDAPMAGARGSAQEASGRLAAASTTEQPLSAMAARRSSARAPPWPEAPCPRRA